MIASLFSPIKKLILLSGERQFLRFSRENFLILGIFLLILLMFSLLFWDGYLFYRVTVKKTDTQSINKEWQQPEHSLDEVLKLLDKRRKKFDEILSAK